jgi:hypothetical protein
MASRMIVSSIYHLGSTYKVKIPTIINDGPTKVVNNQDNNFYLINSRYIFFLVALSIKLTYN